MRICRHSEQDAVNRIQMCISWLAGYSYHPSRVVAGVSKSAFYQSVWKVIEAINESTDPELQLHFPSSDEQILAACSKFRALSSNDVIRGCVGCIDGWLCPIIVPGDGTVAKVKSFFSGHYQKYGLNVQACVDHESRFTAFGVNAPGGMGDAVVYIRWKLSKRIQEINSRILEDHGKTIYLIGDNAYTNSNTPFPRIESTHHDSYNFPLSQNRIRVEMAFGLLVNKWRRLQSPLRILLASVGPFLNSIFILHNFCINRRLEECETDLHDEIMNAVDLNALIVNENNEDFSVYSSLYTASDDAIQGEVDSEVVREAIVDYIRRQNVVRPERNIARRQQQDNSN